MSTLLHALGASASGLSAQRSRLDATASNIANVHTTRGPDGGPYRRQDPVFETLIGKGGLSGVRVAEIAEDQTPARQVFDPGHPDANPEGYVAMPNINLVEEMVNMVSAQRAYEANASSIDATRKMARSALQLLSS